MADQTPSTLNQSSLQMIGNGTYVGDVSYPNYWPQWSPSYYVPLVTEEYANAVEIEAGEYDATIRFYRERSTSKTLVRTVTVPLGLLDLLVPKRGRKR